MSSNSGLEHSADKRRPEQSPESGSGAQKNPAAKPDRAKQQSTGSRVDAGRLGRYVLKRPLGSGGMGTVYLAVDPETNRTVALKLLSKEKSSSPALVRRFQAEAQSAAQLTHENIVNVYDSGEAEGYLYIVLEYVDGIDVQKLLKKQGKLPVRRTLEIVKQVTRALDHAFCQGIVHRDIKPSNMLIMRNGTVKLTDMGLARSVDEAVDTGLTRHGTTVGTVDYMAPEQAQDSKAADIRSDIYSLGCAWYHMLTGSPPFPTGTLMNKLYAHISRPRPDPRKLNPDIPQQVADVVLKMMARSPKERYQTPAELLDVLERISFAPDAFSNRFVSALEHVVEPQPEDDPAASIPSSRLPRTQRNRRRRARRRSRRGRNKAALHGDAFKLLLQEFGKNAGIILAGLTCATILWWILVSLLAPFAF